MALTENERWALEQAPVDEYKAARARAMRYRTLGYQLISAAQLSVAALIYALLGKGILPATVWVVVAAPVVLFVWRECGHRYDRSLRHDSPQPGPPPTPARRNRLMGEAYAAAVASLIIALPTLGAALISGRLLSSGLATCAFIFAIIAVGHTRDKVGIRDELGRDYDGPELAAELASRSSMFTALCASLAWFL